jgi:hypothetical protein
MITAPAAPACLALMAVAFTLTSATLRTSSGSSSSHLHADSALKPATVEAAPPPPAPCSAQGSECALPVLSFPHVTGADTVTLTVDVASGEVVMPQSVSAIELDAVTLSLASPRCNDDGA